MKKIIMGFGAVMAVGLLHAQNLSLGPTAGFGHAWTNSETNGVDRKFHSSYNAGAKLVYSFVSHWGISADVKFSSEGQTVGNDGDAKLITRANYIRVPLQGIYFFGDYGQSVRPKVSLGPSFGFLVGGETKLKNGDETVETAKTKDLAESFDFGLTGAIGANFRIAPETWLNADIAYYHGLTNIPKNSDVDAKNRNLGVNIGVTFPLGTVKPAK